MKIRTVEGPLLERPAGTLTVLAADAVRILGLSDGPPPRIGGLAASCAERVRLFSDCKVGDDVYVHAGGGVWHRGNVLPEE